jgi:hypothetical protein
MRHQGGADKGERERHHPNMLDRAEDVSTSNNFMIPLWHVVAARWQSGPRLIDAFETPLSNI